MTALAPSTVLSALFAMSAGAIAGAGAALLVAPIVGINEEMAEPVERLLARRYSSPGDRPKLVYATVVGLGALGGAVLLLAYLCVFLLAAVARVEGAVVVALGVAGVASVLTVGAVVRTRGFGAETSQNPRAGTFGWVVAGLWHVVAVSFGGGALLYLLWGLAFGMGTH